MHDLRALLAAGDAAVGRLARRGYHLDLDTLRLLSGRRRELTETADELRAESKQLAGTGRGDDQGARQARDRARENKAELQKTEAELGELEETLDGILLTVPNLPADDAPDGSTDDDAVLVRSWGEPPAFDFAPRDHVELGERTGILDLRRATKLSGSRLSVTRGAGARLERALAAFFLDLHTREHGYVEHSVPAVVSRQTMTGTGQLPKFEDDLLRTGAGGRELFLIPTAEVPLTNLYGRETLEEGTLPLAMTAYTECFRGEAGSHGRDTRGLLRLHQFGKVEMVRICAPERADAELELMVGHAEACLRALGLAYRVVQLAAGDLGFSARRTYDLEVWLPSQSRYREVSSVSDCGDFQARRARIRMRRPNGKKTWAATLNGSGLPIGRTFVALLEQGQDADGGVTLPAALVPYAGFARIEPAGTPR